MILSEPRRFCHQEAEPSSGRRRVEEITELLTPALLLASLWLATRPYQGIVDDSVLYHLHVLNSLMPGRYANDLYFRFGSQDQFTIFTPLYKPLVAAVGLGRASMVGTTVVQFAWILSLLYFSRGLFSDARMAIAACALAIALPGGTLFSYGEQFLTPRLLAETLTLTALGLMLRGRPIWCVCLLGLSATVHPIMTLAGFGTLFLFTWAGRWHWWIAGACAVAAVAGLAIANVQPFARLLDRFDPEWFNVVRIRDYFCLVLQWPAYFWIKTLGMTVLAVLALSVAGSRERRLLISVLIVGAGGLLLTFLGGDLLRNVLIVDAQQYRACWPLALTVNMFMAPYLLRVQEPTVSWPIRAPLLCGLGALLLSTFIPLALFVAVPVLICGGFIAVRATRLVGPPAPFAIPTTIAVLGMALCVGVVVMYVVTMWWAGASEQVVSTLVRLLVSVVAAGAILGWAGIIVTPGLGRSPLRHITTSVLCVATALVFWDQRSPWDRMIEAPTTPPASLVSLVPDHGQIYWDGDVRVPWFLLRRPSYFSCTQGTGSLFFRGTAIAYQQRYHAFWPLRTLDIGGVPQCPADPEPAAGASMADIVAALCGQEKDLGVLVLTRRIDGLKAQVWEPPVPFDTLTSDSGPLRRRQVRIFYVYSCPAERSAP